MADNAVVPAAADLITVTIDDIEVAVPKGTLVIRAAEQAGIAIPRFCDHPLLDPVGACRQCLVEVPDAGNGRGFPMPQPSCTTVAAQGMQVRTAASGSRAKAVQEGMLELLLVNHPLDCPVCDKGGECPLQNQAVANGTLTSRYDGVKRQFPKVKPLSEQIVLDRERCVLCTRCTRFADQIAGDPLIGLAERSAKTQVGVWDEQPFASYFSGNVVQICPVGALTAKSYRFSSRPFDLVSVVTTCDGCAAGCQLRADQRHDQVKRRLAGLLPEVNEEWNCDRGRFGFVSGRGDDRLTGPLVRRDGALQPASWPEALDAAAAGLRQAGSRTGVVTGGRLTREAAYAYARFAETLGSADIDCRVRALSAEETAFLPLVAARALGEGVTYADLEQARRVVLVGFEPEDEAPIVFLRLRKAVRKRQLKVTVIGPYLSAGSAKLQATLVPTLPGHEAQALAEQELDADTIVLGGERLATSPGALTALAAVTSRGARWAWVPRRPGEIGALQAGACPTGAGRDTLAQFAALAAGDLEAVVVAGVELADLPDPAAAAAALDEAACVVSLEQRLSDAAQHADVVLPVALLEETSGTFVNWEMRELPVAQVVTHPRSPMTDIRVLAALADALGKPLGLRAPGDAAAALAHRPVTPARPPSVPAPPAPSPDAAPLLATWRELLDDARLLDGEAALAAGARPVVARLHPATASRWGLADATRVRLRPAADRGDPSAGLVFDLVLDPTMVEGAVWAPSRARGLNLAAAGLAAGQPVNVTKEATA